MSYHTTIELTAKAAVKDVWHHSINPEGALINYHCTLWSEGVVGIRHGFKSCLLLGSKQNIPTMHCKEKYISRLALIYIMLCLSSHNEDRPHTLT